MITIHIKSRKKTLTEPVLGYAIGNDRPILKNRFNVWVDDLPDYEDEETLEVDERTISKMIEKYSEQVTYRPLKEIEHWFWYINQGIQIENGYTPLFFRATKASDMSVNISAVAGAGEGVAGYLAQQLYECRHITRPNHDYPDIIMESGKNLCLVEAKATTTNNIETTLKNELPKMVKAIAWCNKFDKRTAEGIIIGTRVINPNEYQCFITKLVKESDG